MTAGRHVYIDYAHNAESLENILEQIKQIHQKKLIVVFGCGGNRDKTKRPKMGAIASKIADQVILTNDNPRFEDPRVIVEEIKSGIAKENLQKVTTLMDRKTAIYHALHSSQPGDCVLVAGKGHETYQIIGEEQFKFSDFECIHQYFDEFFPSKNL